jgi:hypothetical protein
LQASAPSSQEKSPICLSVYLCSGATDVPRDMGIDTFHTRCDHRFHAETDQQVPEPRLCDIGSRSAARPPVRRVWTVWLACN